MTLTAKIPKGWSWLQFHIQEHCRNKKALFKLFPFKSIRDQIWRCGKTGQGKPKVIIQVKPKVIIDINLVVLESQMLHTKFQGNWPRGSGAVFKVFAIYGHDGNLGHVTFTNYINFVSRFTWRLPMKFNWKWPSSFRDTQMTFGQGHLTKWPWPLVFIWVDDDCISISQSTIATEKCTFPAFPIQNPKRPNLTLP